MSNGTNIVEPASSPDQPVKLGGRLNGLSLTKQIIALALWPFLQNLMGTSVSFADRVIAGVTLPEVQHGAVFDAMGLAMYVAWLMMIMQGAIATGAQALVARAFGSHDEDLTERGTGQALLLGIVTGCVSGCIIWLLAPVLTNAFALGGDAGEYALMYLRTIAYSAPFSGVLFVSNACLRAGGDTRTPFAVMAVVNVVNVVLSMWFMQYWMPPDAIGWNGAPNGIAGLAWGTVGGWVVGAVLIVRSMRLKREGKSVVVLRKEYLKWNWSVSRRIVNVGLPQLVEILGMWSIQAFSVWMIANKLSQEGMLGAHGMIVQIESISFMPGFALGTAASTLAGQYLGARSKEMAMYSVRVCWFVGMVVMGTAGLCLVFFAEPLVHLMSPNGGEQVEAAVEVLRYVGWVQPFFATAMVMKMAMRGAGATTIVMVASFTIMLIFRVGVLSTAFYFFPEQMTLKLVWFIMMMDLVAQSVIFVIIYFRKRWLNAEV